jgi:F-type H+-transporting ATPase subunit b
VLVYDPTLDAISGDELVAFVEADEIEGEAVEEEETVNPVLPTGFDMLYAFIFFVALWAAMRYVLLPPINKVRTEREAKIAAARDAADNASADMGSAQADYDAAMAGARSEANAILDAARAEADAHRAEVVGAAEAEAAEIRAAAMADLETARTGAMSSLTDDMASVAAGAAGLIVGRSVDAGTARPAVERALQGDLR